MRDRALQGSISDGGGRFDPFNDFAALAGLRIKFGGQIPQLREQDAMWFLARIGDGPADRTNERGNDIEVADGYCRALAALAGQLHQKLIEHAESHRPYALLRRPSLRTSAVEAGVNDVAIDHQESILCDVCSNAGNECRAGQGELSIRHG